nr:MAG TPA: protein-turn-helix DNA binding protein [Caudoviricetes sp.]
MFYEIVREIITSADMPQVDISEKLGKGKRYISVLLAKIKSTKQSMTVATFARICRVCGARVVVVSKSGRVTDLTELF